MSDRDDLLDLAARPFTGLVKDAVVLTPDFARRIGRSLPAVSTEPSDRPCEHCRDVRLHRTPPTPKSDSRSEVEP